MAVETAKPISSDQTGTQTLPLLPWPGEVPSPLSVVSTTLATSYPLDVVVATAKTDSLFWAVWWPTAFDPLAFRPEAAPVGVVCRLIGSRLLGAGELRVDLEGLFRARLDEIVGVDPILQARVRKVEEVIHDCESASTRVDICYELLTALMRASPDTPVDALRTADLARDRPLTFVDQVAAALRLRRESQWKLAQICDPVGRLEALAALLREELALRVSPGVPVAPETPVTLSAAKVAASAVTSAAVERDRLDSMTRELDVLAGQIASAGLPPHVARRARTELERLRMISCASAEYIEIRNFIDWLIHMPWTATAHERTDPDEIRHALDEIFYGQRRAKERIGSYLSVLHRTGRPAPNVLCIVGPSGIGKTQLARGIAKALRRPLITLNLALLRTEGVLKGNRRTFPGAMPGRIMRQLRAVEVTNPVCLFEEVDRLGGENSHADLTAIVLETVDPEYNRDFWDHYLEFPYDLSRILFLCTATDTESIPEALSEHMEFIELPGYLLEDKIEITFKHLWPRLLAMHNLPPDEFSLTVAAVEKIIREYTLEAGLGNLNKYLEMICRNLAAQRASGQHGFVRVGAHQVEKLLGTPIFIPERAETSPEIGVAMGVAWTQAGGDIMLIEALKMRGSGNVISTGSLGEVMRESIQAAHSYVRSRADWLEIKHTDFANFDIHVHFPSGAIPKDGPSAGITITVAIASVMSDRPVRNDYAMTGEVSLRGKVLPVGGIKEKVAAAHRVGIHKIIVPKQNVKDLQDVPRRIAKEMNYVPVETMDEVFEHVLLDFSPARASLERLLRLERALRRKGRKPRPKAGTSTRAGGKKRARVRRMSRPERKRE